MIEIQKNRFDESKEERHEYNLLNADAVRRIGDTEAILVSANKNPAILRTRPYFAHRRFQKIPKRYGRADMKNGVIGGVIKRVEIRR